MSPVGHREFLHQFALLIQYWISLCPNKIPCVFILDRGMNCAIENREKRELQRIK